MLFIPTTRLRGRRMCIVFVTCLTEGAREALSTPKHPKLTKVKNNPFLAPHDRPFFKEAIWKARFFYSPPPKKGDADVTNMTSPTSCSSGGGDQGGIAVSRCEKRKILFEAEHLGENKRESCAHRSRASLPLVFSPHPPTLA